MVGHPPRGPAKKFSRKPLDFLFPLHLPRQQQDFFSLLICCWHVSAWYDPKRAVKMSMITTAAWVPRGFAAPFPQKYTFDEEEFERIAQLAKLQLDDANEDLREAQEESKPNGGSVSAQALQGSEPEEKQESVAPIEELAGILRLAWK